MDFNSIAASFGGAIWSGLFFIVAIAIIVAVHEYGHYIVGRWSGIHAEVFSLGFGPVIYSRVDKRGTKWQIAALPIGGYVKFLGDKDAASAAPDQAALGGLTADEKRHTMFGAPLWARAATVAAGPIFNFILALVVFMGMITYTGVATDVPVVGRVNPTPFIGATIQPGDQILALNGTATPDMAKFAEVAAALPPAASVTYKVDRNGTAIDVQGAHPFLPMVGAVMPKNAGGDAGIQTGDVIVQVAGQDVSAFSQLPALVEATQGKPIALKIWRDNGSGGDIIDLTLSPNRRDLPKDDGTFETRWMIGLSGGMLFAPQTRQPGVWETVTIAVDQAWFTAKSSLSGLWHVVTGQISSCNLSGPVGMAQVMGDAARQGFQEFLGTLGMLSLGIGLLNLFPIPVLDGGHLMFYAYEAVFRRPPAPAVMNILMLIGLMAVLSFMFFALGNDFTCK
ncbi:RIP metalloprotease RseP [Cypionkella sp.]|uniref:RIP metalloprotease RseP n=1 Tax=Cypionkella sp. TaxID=2811411 RepID=UPI002634D623|nr:RIP metalloprotease RseP [Cypionkella sp.]MDB5666580.1 rane-associated zinc metalloprotease [Cypionkella sp.]